MESFLFREVMNHWGTGYLKNMQLLSLLSGAFAVWSEALQKNPAAYSKFADATKLKGKMLPSRVGMLLLYTPSAFAALSVVAWKMITSEASPEAQPSMRFWLVAAALALHFHKRVLEVLFVHRYSGSMEAGTATVISFTYTMSTLNLLLAQHIAESLPPPAVDTIETGIAVFFLGIVGNFYHHLLLRNLRSDGSKKYVIPQGGLFPVFVAPHYVFETIEFLGLALISQTMYSVAILAVTALYLGSRSYGTKVWYRKKIDGFPSNRCAFIPFVL